MVLQEKQFFTFDIWIDWSVIRLVWIGFCKNVDNDQCLLDKLPKDVIIHVLRFLGTDVGSHDTKTHIKL